MNENIELLEYIYQNAEMGSFTLTTLINELQDKENKIKKIVEDEIKEYEKYLKNSKTLIEQSKYDLRETGMMSKMGASMGIKKETRSDNSDAAIAHMIIEGLTMGVVDISTKIKNYKDVADKKVISLAEDFLKFQEDEIERLKDFL
ncbi:MAG: hypothetical protein E7173_02985 [Firmicutes bacterium]|nr:hypothetical protein [Bacillota bacterium]